MVCPIERKKVAEEEKKSSSLDEYGSYWLLVGGVGHDEIDDTTTIVVKTKELGFNLPEA
jgi:hypothetical protein